MRWPPDLINTTIDPLFQQDPRLVVLVGTDLVAAARAKLYSRTHQAERADRPPTAGQVHRRAQGLYPALLPGQADGGHHPGHLHCYTQRGTRKRKADDNQDGKASTTSTRAWRAMPWASTRHAAASKADIGSVLIRQFSPPKLLLKRPGLTMAHPVNATNSVYSPCTGGRAGRLLAT